VLDVYKAAAPHIDVLAPDLYTPGSTGYEATLNWYTRPDNPLFVAETSDEAVYARYLFTALGHRTIGFDPFGFDFTGYANFPLGAKKFDAETIAPFRRLYGLFGPMAREWARMSFESDVWGVSEPDDHSAQALDLGPKWSAQVTYRQWQFGMLEWDKEHGNGYPEGSDIPSGGVAVARLSDNEFLVTGINARISFGGGRGLGSDRAMILDRVEEGHFDNGQWVFERVLNGDETDYGINFTTTPMVLKVRLGSYVK
jgi:beta-galactosidase GanA